MAARLVAVLLTIGLAGDVAAEDQFGPRTETRNEIRPKRRGFWFNDTDDVRMDVFRFPRGPGDGVIGDYGPPVGAGFGFCVRGFVVNIHGAIQKVPDPDESQATGVTATPMRNIVVVARVGWEF